MKTKKKSKVKKERVTKSSVLTVFRQLIKQNGPALSKLAHE